mmetsp:Transcript_31261/g.38055  ORF Transcript_31261/g.38055 Transcript_31261/m.38055 type:complete len:328 (+) Transcript_31261:67-1050(+)
MDNNKKPLRKIKERPLLLLSLESYCVRGSSDDDDKTKKKKDLLPSRISIGCTVVFIFVLLVLVELTFRQVLISLQNLHPLLQDETKRNILARHIGVDALCCFVVASMGYNARHILHGVSWKNHSIFGKKNAGKLGTTTTTTNTSNSRVFQYYPEGARILVFFLAFQCKNLIDTIIWNDGPVYIMHHILAIYSSVGGLIPGGFQFYAIFYMGLSEASTGILCLLANFDENGHGVEGLADAFPITKLVLGTIFAISFIYIRIYLWMILTLSYYFPDVQRILQQNSESLLLTKGKKLFFYFNSASLGILTLLQLIWLLEIFRGIKMELFG